jgi:hypothetical protein
MYPTFSAVYNQDGLGWSTIERYTRSERQSVTPTEALFNSLADGTELRMMSCSCLLGDW